MKIHIKMYRLLFFVLFSLALPIALFATDAAVEFSSKITASLTDMRRETRKEELLEKYGILITSIRQNANLSRLDRWSLYDQIRRDVLSFHPEIIDGVQALLRRARSELSQLTAKEKIKNFFLSVSGKAVTLGGLAVILAAFVKHVVGQEVKPQGNPGPPSPRPESQPLPGPGSSPTKEPKISTEQKIVELLKQQDNPHALAQRYSQPVRRTPDAVSPIEMYDGVIFKENAGFFEGATDAPVAHDFQMKFHSQAQDLIQGRLIFVQVPTLYQGGEILHTNYCGYYALYLSSILQNAQLTINQGNLSTVNNLKEHIGRSLSGAGINDRSKFIPFFEKALNMIKESRNKPLNEQPPEMTPWTRISEYPSHIQAISELREGEIMLLYENASQLGIDVSRVHLIKDLGGLKVVKAQPYWNQVQQFAAENKNTLNVPRNVYIVTTAQSGSHWLTLSLEKVNGIVIAILVDSLGINRGHKLHTELNEDFTTQMNRKTQE